MFPFLVPFSFVLSFRLVLVSFSFVLSFRFVVFRLFLVSPSSLFFSLSCFPWWRILLFCYFVSALHPPARSLRAWSMRIPLACCLLSCVLDVDLLFLLLFLPFFDLDLDIVCFILSFSRGCYAVSSVFVSVATRLAYRMRCILIRTHADLTYLFLSEVYDLFQLLCVVSSVFYFVFLSYWSLSCDHVLHCSHDLM